MQEEELQTGNLFGDAKREIYLDIETLRLSDEVSGGWSNIKDFGLAVAVTWDETNGFRRWYESDAARLLEELKGFRRIITFNGERFDFEVLRGYGDTSKLYPNSLDLLVELKRILGFRVKLESVARETLGKSKTGVGTDAVKWWRAGDKEKVAAYCEQDVQLLRELVTFARANGHVVADGKKVRVDWKE